MATLVKKTINQNICVCCGNRVEEGEGMVCQDCKATGGPAIRKNNLHIENSYNIWDKTTMFSLITEKCNEVYGSYLADQFLNRSYTDMYVEWYLHNIGYWLTLPFVKNSKIKSLNERFKHVDLEEHI